MAGGDLLDLRPIDVTQYTLDEMKAAIEAAGDWNTYVAVHASTPRAVRRALEAGVKCIEHGQLLDAPTIELMAQKGVWLSAQNLVPDSPNMAPERREKRKPVVEGNARVWPMPQAFKNIPPNSPNGEARATVAGMPQEETATPDAKQQALLKLAHRKVRDRS